MRRVLILSMVLGCFLMAALSLRQLETVAATRNTEQELLYLPNGKYMKLASLGQAALLSDLVYLWAIQYYSNYNREDRFEFVEHVFSDVIAELDPHNVDPYWLGAMILSVEAHDDEAALKLLDKGFANNPDEWILPYLAGWTAHHAGMYKRASDYFDLAAGVPTAPPVVLRLRAGMIKRMGDVEEALALWTEVVEDPRCDEKSRRIAARQIRELTVRWQLKMLQDAVDRFRTQNGHNPRRLEDLVNVHYISSLPIDPDGAEYLYDSRTGEVSSKAAQILGGRK
jgi:tetratricopeptide (TPR) repeat protein